MKLVKIEGGRTIDVSSSPRKDYIAVDDGPTPNMINHKNGKQQGRPFSGLRPQSTTKQRFMQTHVNPTSAWVQDASVNKDGVVARSSDRAGAVTKAADVKESARAIEDYAAKANTTLLQLKAQRVHNNSVQRLMDDIFRKDAEKTQEIITTAVKTGGGQSRQGSKMRLDNNFNRYDQSPQPNYPNFE